MNLDATYHSRNKQWTGLYYDKKTLAYEVTFIKTPLTNTEPAKKQATSTPKSAPAKKKEEVVKVEEPVEEVIVEEPVPEVTESQQSSGNILGEDTQK